MPVVCVSVPAVFLTVVFLPVEFAVVVLAAVFFAAVVFAPVVFVSVVFVAVAFAGVLVVFAGVLVVFAGPPVVLALDVTAVLTGSVVAAARAGAGPCSSSYSTGRAAAAETEAGLPQMSDPRVSPFVEHSRRP
jgi:hypothetical protein